LDQAAIGGTMRTQHGGETMRDKLCTFLIVVLVSAFAGLAQEDGAQDEAINLSIDRRLGVGMQLDFPFGGLLSVRYWISPGLAGEAILFLWGDAGDIEGTITGRALVRIADRPAVDFYGAFGASVPLTSHGENAITLLAVGGIEFGFRLAPDLTWNLEFGLGYALDGDVSMVFGTGVHFYF